MPTRFSLLHNGFLRGEMGFVLRITVLAAAMTGSQHPAEAFVAPAQSLQQQQQQMQFFRLHVGSECEQSADCIGGECRLDPVAGNGRKSCVCLENSLKFIVAPALEICLKCRDLNALCSFDQECQCTDSNAICDNQAPAGKGRCRCRNSDYTPVVQSRGTVGSRGNFTCQTGGVNSSCASDKECALIKFADSNGKLQDLATGVGGLRKSPLEAKCGTPPITKPPKRPPFSSTAAPPSLPDLSEVVQAGLEELDVFDYSSSSSNTSSSPPTTVTTSQPLPHETVLPEPRGNLSATGRPGVCQCPEGFVPSPSDTFVCQDVDECRENGGVDRCNPTHLENAHTACVNTLGGFRCECNGSMALGQGLATQGGICCLEGHIPCLDGSRCISFSRLCDGHPDCGLDCSDELYPFCNVKYQSFPDFSRYPQCHEGMIQEDNGSSAFNKLPTTTSSVVGESTPVRDNDQQDDLLPLGASTQNPETPPSVLPTLPSNMTAARLLGYVLI